MAISMMPAFTAGSSGNSQTSRPAAIGGITSTASTARPSSAGRRTT